MSTHPHHTSQPPHLTGSRQLLSIPACSAAPPVLTGTPAKEIAAVGFGCMWNVAQIFPHGDLLARSVVSSQDSNSRPPSSFIVSRSPRALFGILY
ncbi:uncharacterized protein LAJ45_09945 [Morchella importuna]|uniref:uncharacterized protein n=1 Tax=Morchella importuna TaxID=1174673 RepID=UPI001E8E9928|nr:uncharacterized protein LAJ45_09945 [Morchella importuna]KAH8146023.1 hypothetical protein LAJ45_09945 [Morchella importuna]